jgi:multidrug efflux pump subunit AcrA (membrane-fusion protein)
VRQKHADRGQYVTPGAPLARVFAVDYAEIRLAISDTDLVYLDLPLGLRLAPPVSQPLPQLTETDTDTEPLNEGLDGAPDPSPSGPRVILAADFAGERREWVGHVVRTEGALDARTRMVNVVARVEDPYRRGRASGQLPLPIGLFVEASIEGRLFDDVFELPRSALRRRDTVWVVAEDGRLEHRSVEVLRSIGDRTFIRAGLADGELVITSALDAALDGMKVQSIELPDPGASAPAPAAS